MKGRYAFVGLFCAGLHNIVMIGGDLVSLNYLVSSLLSFAIVLTSGFALHCAFTFSAAPGLRSFLRYTLAMALNLPMSILILFLLFDLGGVPMAIAAPFATVLMFALNYLLSAWAIVPKPPSLSMAERRTG